MGGKRAGMLMSSAGLGVSTILSKLLGVVRDMMVAAMLGTSSAAGAWTIALIAPNLFRRIFGEGAVGTAMVPMLAESIAKPGGRAYAAKQLRAILLTVCAILLVVTALGMVIPLVVSTLMENRLDEYGQLVCASIPAAMPYAVFICMAGVATAALNMDKQFFWPGITTLLFNVCTIALLGTDAYFHFGWGTGFLLVMMCVSVTVSGVLQLGALMVLLYRRGLLAPMVFKELPWRSTLTELWRLSLPAILGSSALQLSMVLDWALAGWLGGTAVSALTYAEHVAFLPTSAVALSLGVVGLSHMTRAHAEGDMDEVKSIFNFGMRYVLFLSVPMAVFTGVFAPEIVSVLFQRHRFDAQSVAETVLALRALAFGIPLFCTMKVVASAFQARKDMVTPMKVSFYAIGANAVCSLALMWYFRQGGIAAAMIISSLINNVVLLWLLYKGIGSFGAKRIVKSASLSILCSGAAVAPFIVFWDKLPAFKLIAHVTVSALPLLIAGSGFVVLYALLGLVCGSEEMKPLIRRLRGRLGGMGR